MFIQIITHEIHLALSRGSGVYNLFAFFIIAAVLFPFGIGPEADTLHVIGVGVIWVCALLTSMLSLPLLFNRDYEDGTLEQWLLQGQPPEMVVLAKITAHWCIANLPLVCISPFLAYMFQLEQADILCLMLSLLLGTPTLSLIGATGAALVLGARRAGALLGLLVLPLYIPVLIFGAAAEAEGAFYLLLAMLCAMLPVSIIACTFALKMAIEEA